MGLAPAVVQGILEAVLCNPWSTEVEVFIIIIQFLFFIAKSSQTIIDSSLTQAIFVVHFTTVRI